MRRLGWAVMVATCGLGLAAAPAGAVSAVYTVDKVADASGGACDGVTANDCSLRDAITQANASGGADTISFAALGPGTHTLTIGSALPPITEAVTIDGYSATDAVANSNPAFTGAFEAGGLGSNAHPKIELDLSNQRGLVVDTTGGGTTIKGLAIYGVQERVFVVGDPPTIIQSYAIELRSGGNRVTGNFIGLSAAGTPPADFTDLNKQAGVGVLSGNDNVIGGTAPADRNVISANAGANGAGGIHYEGGSNSKIQGNLIGTTPDGTDIPTIDVAGDPVDLNNGFRGGIEVLGFNPGIVPITNLTIGGTAPGAGNVVSGNLHDSDSGAVNIFGGWTTPEVHVLGNRIGTDVTGTSALGNNTGAGVYALGTTEIGDDEGHGNLISGNGSNGLRFDGEGHTIQGNRIGTNAAGTGAIANRTGISTRADNVLIGGTTPLAGNVISGNEFNGITGDTYDNNDIQGNFIGTNALGTAAVPNGLAGIVVAGGTGNTIGGAAADSDNVVSGNGQAGVLLTHPGEGSSATQNEVLGNFIGTGAAGSGAIPNGGPGIQTHLAGRNVIGRPGEGNTIANNAGDGVLIGGTPGQFGSDVFENNRNAIRGNSIFANGQLGIDLGEDADDPLDDGDGVTPNDAGDQDIGNNDLQNFPQVNAALTGSTTAVSGSINSRANTTYDIDLYRATSCDGSGNGEGEQYLGSTTTTTDGAGDASWSTTVTTAVPLGQLVTATATDPAGNTSEFSACREAAQQPQQPQQTQQPTVTPQQQQPALNPCRDKKAPITTLKKAGVKNNKRGSKLILSGRSADHRDCPSGVARVDVSLARVAGRTGTNCRFIKKANRLGLTRPQNCRRPVLFKSTGTDKWTFTFPVRLPKGLYRVQARGTDKAKNKETPKKNRNIVFFEVK